MTTLAFVPPGPRTAGWVLAHLDKLTVTQRQVFVLHGASGLSIAETARRMGLARAAVRSIFRGAAQRLADATATPQPAVSEPETAPAACPPWCGGECKPDAADGSVYHMGPSVTVGDVEVGLSRLDDEDTGQGAASVDVLIGMASAELTPARALALAEVLREQALAAAGAEGVEMRADQLRLDDQILMPDGWETVEIHDVDGWLAPKHADKAVRVNTEAHEEDEDAYRFAVWHMLRVRKSVAQ
ncbi:sigma-70 region 4 domain-containing protein [Phytohabitans sp. ZYX-F-186]|uniref:Sigma-70 region 4 domain-containing protein n=1 Tax=Phytohabitans maris TaxID=3071409 RepID=A0ABU0ZEM3_9ACTN|nr:sigma-70 region 4 domain-containing protein [Phytohabitans sp. ZYX-F-186]MDQ7905508.1 sigma-70 region 4 domain-containing protein [Phytohabitans sp. ZYX-F-186]